MSDVVTVAVDQLPFPDDSCPWQNIIDFRTEMKNRVFAGRVFAGRNNPHQKLKNRAGVTWA